MVIAAATGGIAHAEEPVSELTVKVVNLAIGNYGDWSGKANLIIVQSPASGTYAAILDTRNGNLRVTDGNRCENTCSAESTQQIAAAKQAAKDVCNGATVREELWTDGRLFTTQQFTTNPGYGTPSPTSIEGRFCSAIKKGFGLN